MSNAARTQRTQNTPRTQSVQRRPTPRQDSRRQRSSKTQRPSKDIRPTGPRPPEPTPLPSKDLRSWRFTTADDPGYKYRTIFMGTVATLAALIAAAVILTLLGTFNLLGPGSTITPQIWVIPRLTVIAVVSIFAIKVAQTVLGALPLEFASDGEALWILDWRTLAIGVPKKNYTTFVIRHMPQKPLTLTTPTHSLNSSVKRGVARALYTRGELDKYAFTVIKTRRIEDRLFWAKVTCLCVPPRGHKAQKKTVYIPRFYPSFASLISRFEMLADK